MIVCWQVYCASQGQENTEEEGGGAECMINDGGPNRKRRFPEKGGQQKSVLFFWVAPRIPLSPFFQPIFCFAFDEYLIPPLFVP